MASANGNDIKSTAENIGHVDSQSNSERGKMRLIITSTFQPQILEIQAGIIAFYGLKIKQGIGGTCAAYKK